MATTLNILVGHTLNLSLPLRVSGYSVQYVTSEDVAYTAPVTTPTGGYPTSLIFYDVDTYPIRAKITRISDSQVTYSGIINVVVSAS